MPLNNSVVGIMWIVGTYLDGLHYYYCYAIFVGDEKEVIISKDYALA